MIEEKSIYIHKKDTLPRRDVSSVDGLELSSAQKVRLMVIQAFYNMQNQRSVVMSNGRWGWNLFVGLVGNILRPKINDPLARFGGRSMRICDYDLYCETISDIFLTGEKDVHWMIRKRSIAESETTIRDQLYIRCRHFNHSPLILSA